MHYSPEKMVHDLLCEQFDLLIEFGAQWLYVSVWLVPQTGASAQSSGSSSLDRGSGHGLAHWNNHGISTGA